MQQSVYEALKKGISSARYAPGAHLREIHIAEELGVSRTPVREAIRRLGGEGWVELLPNRGARVTQWSMRDIEEIFEARALIEPWLAGQAALRATPAQIDELEALALKMQDMFHAEGAAAIVDRWFEANKAFHDQIAAAAGNRRLEQSLAAIKDVPLIRWTFATFGDGDHMRSIREHLELVQALRTGERAWAEAIMRCHILAARTSVVRRAEHPEPETET